MIVTFPWHGLVARFGAILVAVRGTYCEFIGFLSTCWFVEKCTLSKDLRPIQADSPRTQGEVVTVSCGEILKNFVVFFVPVGRTSGTVTVNIAKFL
jgi:hypothetical protein